MLFFILKWNIDFPCYGILRDMLIEIEITCTIGIYYLLILFLWKVTRTNFCDKLNKFFLTNLYKLYKGYK